MIRSSEDVILNISAQPNFFLKNGDEILNSEAVNLYSKKSKHYEQRQRPLSFCDSDRCRYRNRYYKSKEIYTLNDFFGKGGFFILSEIDQETKRCKECNCEVVWSRSYNRLQ